MKEEVIKHPGVIDPIHPSKFKFGFPKSISYTPILVVLLLVASFFMGMLTDKIQYLSSNNGSTPSYGNQQAAAPNQPNQPQAPNPGQKQDVAVGNYPPKGNPNAKVTIVAFEDFRCPFCEKLFTDTEPQLQKDYIDTGKVKFYYRNYQFLGPASVVAGNAGECANEQGKFWEFHDYMYKNQPTESDTSMYTTDNLTQVAGQLGMNTSQFQSCLDSKKYDKNVSDDLAAGQKAGVSGTPTLFIDGLPVVGAQPYSAFKTLIDQELAKK